VDKPFDGTSRWVRRIQLVAHSNIVVRSCLRI
jgi:hypothetical protein